MALSRCAFPLAVVAALAGCMSPMTKAAKSGDAAAVQSLIAAGQDPSAQDGWLRTPMYWAAYYDQTAVVAALIKAKVVPDQEAVHAAVIHGNQEITRMMVAAGGQVNWMDADKIRSWQTAWATQDAARAAARPEPIPAPAPEPAQEKPWWKK